MNRITSFLNPKTGKGPFSYTEHEKRPNILLVTMDMVPPEFHDGSAPIRTPAQKSLVNEGISFSNAFASSPLCGPSRASTLTGRYTYITGNSERSHDGHRTVLRSEDIIWPEYLKAAGYHCRHIGKSHVGTEHFMRAFTENSSPWDRWSPPWYDEDLYIRFLRDKGLERFSFRKEIRGCGWTGERNGNSYGGWLADQNGKPFPEDALYPSFLVNRAINALETQGNTKPFYLQLDFFGPHQPFAIPGGWDEREDEIRSRTKLPESWLEWEAAGFPDSFGDSRVYDLYRRNWGMKNRSDMTDYLVANQLQYEILDKQLGRLLDYLKESGLYENTLIFFIADHGEMNGRKGCIDKGAYLNPQVLRVPLYLKPPKSFEISAGSVVETPASLLDLFPTICEIVGLEIPERIDGMSLLSLRDAEHRPEDRPVMFDVWNHVVPNPCVGRILEENGRKYLYSYNAMIPEDELYDLSEKGRIGNIINDDEDLRRRLRLRMDHSLSADARWEVYKGYFRLEYAAELELTPHDNQKFE